MYTDIRPPCQTVTYGLGSLCTYTLGVDRAIWIGFLPPESATVPEGVPVASQGTENGAMTIVLGQRPNNEREDILSARKAAWVQHFRHPERKREIPEGPAPVPLAEVRMHVPDVDSHSWPRRDSRPDGLVGMYANRIEAQRAQRIRTGRRLSVSATVQSRPATVVRETVSIGRGTDRHYERLYPSKKVPGVGRVREGISMRLSEETSAYRQLVAGFQPAAAFRTMRRTMANALQAPRLQAPRRAVIASLMAFVLVAGAATSSLAQQQRYEVQPGDTLESIAAEFGVNAEGIYRSSYMPNGWSVAPGQVVVIPGPGQTPDEAAWMAMEREGTSPWVAGAHWVEYGDTFGSIAAQWGVNADTLISFNQHIDPLNLIPGERVLIPFEREDSTAGTSAYGHQPLVSLPVAHYVQSRNLSCEFAATYAATTAFGAGVPEQIFIDTTPLAANPHYGYRGNIDGQWGNTDDYGIYAEALVPTLNANGFYGEVMYTQGDVNPLISHLDAGHPVVVWLGFWGDTREVLTDQDTYSVFAGMHVVTVTGYDDSGVYVMDPAKGVTNYYDWGTFQDMWAIVDGMGLAVYPM